MVLNTSEAKPITGMLHTTRVKLDVHLFSQVDDIPAVRYTRALWQFFHDHSSSVTPLA